MIAIRVNGWHRVVVKYKSIFSFENGNKIIVYEFRVVVVYFIGSKTLRC